MRWLRRVRRHDRAPAAGPRAEQAGKDVAAALDPEAPDGEPFACSTCGRTDLPPAGDWDPPICRECDEEINFAAIEEVELTEEL